MKKPKTKNQKLKTKSAGFSIIEVIAAILIFSIIAVSIYGSFKAGLQSLSQSKYRVAATELANEKMEIVRNMAYSDIGTVGGVPSGVLVQNETIWNSNLKFNVHTFIRYVDDPFDGTQGGNPNDTVPTDYKEVKIEVTWAEVQSGHGVKLVSNFVPNGVETNVGGGTFRLNILDGSGNGLQGAEAHIINTNVNPHIDIDTLADSFGSILLTGMPASDRGYIITVSKSGYETVTTLPPYPTTSFDPTDVHASVMEGDLNTKAIIIDKLGSLHILFHDIADYSQMLSGVHFNLNGGRVIGLLYGTTTPVTNFNQNFISDINGNSDVTNIAPGKYAVTLNEPAYTVVAADPVLPIALAPEEDIEENILLASNTVNSLIVNVKDSQTGSVLPNVSVRIYNGSGFDITQITGQEGRVYFPPNTDPPTVMSSGNYTLDVSEPNHKTSTQTVNISNLVQKNVALDPTTP